jgi:hypothetical protein
MITSCYSNIKDIKTTFICIDKSGLSIQYEFQFDLKLSRDREKREVELVKQNIHKIVRKEIDNYDLIDDCLLNRDSVERILIRKIEETSTKDLRILNLEISDLAIPDFMMKVIEHRHPELLDIKTFKTK